MDPMADLLRKWGFEEDTVDNFCRWLVNARFTKRKSLIRLGIIEPALKRSRSGSTGSAPQSPIPENPRIELDHLKVGEIEKVETAIEQLLSESAEPKPEKNVEANTRMDSIRRKTKRHIIKDYLVDFTANSNLHGLKYIGEKKRTFPERIFWLFMFICSVVICSGLIRKVWIKWNESPVIVSFAETSTPVWQIPYPAVTLCFETKAKQTVFNFTDVHLQYVRASENLTEQDRMLLEDISLLCDDHLPPADGRKFSDGVETLRNIKMVAPNITEVIFGCKWKNMPTQNCTDLFSPILTEEGQCYTFNTLGADEMFRLENLHTEYPYLEHDSVTENWTLDSGYLPQTPLETYPHRGSGYGAKAGLTFLMTAKEADMDYLCKGPVQGFKILLHNPAELPRLSQQYFRAPLDQEVVVAVKPNMMTTSEGLRPYDPTRRLCYFPSERYLKYFKVYTQANCEMECLSNFTNIRCGCVQFGMPRSSDMKVCNAGSAQCMSQAQMELVTIEILVGLDKSSDETLSEAHQIASQCKCLPACTSIEYEAELSQADYDWKEIFQVHGEPIPEELMDQHFTRVFIYFKEAQFITSRRSELYGQTDFLANCGGLLGLFMGFSILSVAEIIYFLTLRLCCIITRYRRRTKIKNASMKSRQSYND